MLYSFHNKLVADFIMTKKTNHLIMDFKPISLYLYYLKMRSKFFNYSIMNSHEPTEKALEKNMDEFYEDLKQLHN